MSSTTIRVKGAEEARRALGAAEGRARTAVGRAVVKTLIQGEAHMKRLLSQPGRGRLYGAHRASAPGQPPAVDTGTYRASWRHRFGGIGSASPTGDVYTEQERGPWLEFGTARMAARPHAGPVSERMAEDFRDNTVEALRATSRGGT